MEHGSIPITFNALKHHTAYIKSFISRSRFLQLEQRLKPIGVSTLDLYIGELTIETIFAEVTGKLKELGVAEEDKYNEWLKEHQGYYVMDLSDGSRWVLRESNTCGLYVHIHPGRYSVHTIRARANKLKTAVATAIALKEGVIDDINLSSVNFIRTNIIKLPPVKNLSPEGSVMKLMDLLLLD